jgi:hypothetical protein
MPGLRLGTLITGNEIDIVLEATKSTWIGFGLSKGSSTSMTGDGLGVDTYVCTNGAVQQYWMTTKSAPACSNPLGCFVDGSSCTQTAGKTTMAFRRTLAGLVAITPGTGQVIIYATGTGIAMSYHLKENRTITCNSIFSSGCYSIPDNLNIESFELFV